MVRLVKHLINRVTFPPSLRRFLFSSSLKIALCKCLRRVVSFSTVSYCQLEKFLFFAASSICAPSAQVGSFLFFVPNHFMLGLGLGGLSHDSLISLAERGAKKICLLRTCEYVGVKAGSFVFSFLSSLCLRRLVE